MNRLIDVHSHVTPFSFPAAPDAAAAERWPCMHCRPDGGATINIGNAPFRELDSRSWDGDRRTDDMDADGVAIQVLSPMPELLSYWLQTPSATTLCECSNHQIADLISKYPDRFRGLGTVPLQDIPATIAELGRLKSVFGLSGVEIGSNINGAMPGEPQFDPFWEAAEALELAVFVHALHPVAAKAITPPPFYVPFALFPVDVAMAAASILLAGITERFPRLRIGFSHGGGALGAILGRLDSGWHHTEGYGQKISQLPSVSAQRLFYDSNVYDAKYLKYLAEVAFPGKVFTGTDYPYQIMQKDPADFVRTAQLDRLALESLTAGAAGTFLAEDFSHLVRPPTGSGMA
ncbi:amidohydrolase family protein [Sphingopyxis granuli]|uniref:amidohydrolase family protein n=1 Tax=Sphingopyxis granuli TaxID=267128 RepID=UPI001F531811|nr:amidohydrolase family protein [Sphingopyxis granuli]UNK81076.1 amidohydrolase family protein [Sphingopyxis granuli]